MCVGRSWDLLGFTIEERIGSEERNHEGAEAAAVFEVGLVGGNENGGVVEGFVSSHPVAEGVTHKGLACAV